MSRKKKQPLNSLIEVDGQDKKVPTTLDQVWGDEGLSKYGTTDENVYFAKLDEMLFVDMQDHARTVGLRPDVEPRILKDRLIAEFRKHVASYQRVSAPSKSQNVPLNSKVKNILGEGR